MQCPKCGYMMSAFDAECPRCKRIGGGGHVTTAVPPSVEPLAQLNPTVEKPAMSGWAILWCVVAVLLPIIGLIAGIIYLISDHMPSRVTGRKVLLLSLLGVVLSAVFWTVAASVVSRDIASNIREYSTEPSLFLPEGDGSTTAADAAGGAWHTINTWEGNTNKTTEMFEVTSRDWAIAWNAKQTDQSSVFSITVHNSQGDPVELPVNTMGSTEDSTQLHNGPGTFYLEVNSLFCAWSVNAQDLR